MFRTARAKQEPREQDARADKTERGMSIVSRIVMAGAALAVAGCSQLPGANLGGTFTAENYLGASLSGDDFNSALAREYQALAVRSARTDVNWMDSTAYIGKSQAAAAGDLPM